MSWNKDQAFKILAQDYVQKIVSQRVPNETKKIIYCLLEFIKDGFYSG